MTARQLAALETLRFNWAEGPDDVWSPSVFHVRGLNQHVERGILSGLAEAASSPGTSPVGLILMGQRGTGKTHLLGWTRERVQQEGGYFFLMSLLDARTFWESAVGSMLDGLSREGADGEPQLKIFLRRLSALVAAPRWVQREVIGNRAVSKEGLDAFVTALRLVNGQIGRDTRDTLRALVLRASADPSAQDVGDAFLNSLSDGERAHWGISQGQKSPQEIVRDLSRLLALTGPSVIAVDQIDVLVAQSALSTEEAQSRDRSEAVMIEQIAGGLMALREVTRRTLTVLSCLPATWILIRKRATDTVGDRFRTAVELKRIPDAELGRALVEKRFAVRFAGLGFEPPYPSWPVRPSAFELAWKFTPRQLLIKIDEHVEACLADVEVRELHGLDQAVAAPSSPSAPGVDLGALDLRFAELRKAAEALEPDPATEDTVMPALLAAGLSAWIAELGEAGRAFTVDPPPSKKPPLHARLRRVLDEESEDEAHWAFRAIGSPNAIAALSRLRGASVAAGLNAEVPKRRLFVLRNVAWSRGPRTAAALAEFRQAGGEVLEVGEEDLRTLSALRALHAENPPNLRAWLAARRPAREVKVLRRALSDLWRDTDGRSATRSPDTDGRSATRSPDTDGRSATRSPDTDGRSVSGRQDTDGRFVSGPQDTDGRSVIRLPDTDGRSGGGSAVDASAVTGPIAFPSVTGPRPAPVPGGGPYLVLGRTLADGQPVTVGLEALRKHIAIFAGSGSGKTVLIRRLVEECALQGVSAIVLDPNNDLARLGDSWPEPPPQWGPGDAGKAADYQAGTDVVIWTPRRGAGRPLSFQPLPDFASVVDDADEFGEAVDAAVASLLPRAKLDARTNKAQLGQAVLREAVEHYGRAGGPTGLRGLIGVLAALPYGVSKLGNAEKIAADLAQTLTAAMVNDPLFGGDGAPADPGVLLTPAPGRRARISVISLVGLQSDEQRQSFVNQLQMALFAWIKRHPAGDRPLGGLFVMDEAQTFAPSGAMTACTQSTLALASQARKYGLGLVFATQAPKGLHNRIPGNAATQFFGLLNSPAQIEAAKEMARAKGGEVADISRLTTGQFYLAAEGSAFVKTATPLCLSHHPQAPLTVEEVIKRASLSSLSIDR